MNRSEANRLTLEKNSIFQDILNEIQKTVDGGEHFFIEMRIPNLRDNWGLYNAILSYFRDECNYDVNYNKYTDELYISWQ